MANRKVVEMSEDREVNGEDVNGFTTFTLSAVNADFDITVTVQADAVSGCDVGSLMRLAQRSYSHVLSNEAASAGINRDKDRYPDLDDFLKTWRQNKRAQIVSGEYTTRQVGPRISPEEKELRRLIIEELLKPRWTEPKPFPTSGKAQINGQTLDYWVDYCAKSPKYTSLHDKAKANVEAARNAAAQAKASAATFADL